MRVLQFLKFREVTRYAYVFANNFLLLLSNRQSMIVSLSSVFKGNRPDIFSILLLLMLCKTLKVCKSIVAPGLRKCFVALVILCMRYVVL